MYTLHLLVFNLFPMFHGVWIYPLKKDVYLGDAEIYLKHRPDDTMK